MICVAQLVCSYHKKHFNLSSYLPLHITTFIFTIILEGYFIALSARRKKKKTNGAMGGE